MQIPSYQIYSTIESYIKIQLEKLEQRGIKLKLKTILADNSKQQLSFVNIKQKVAKKLGIDFELIQIDPNSIFYEQFLRTIKKEAKEKTTNGIIIQQPLPANLSSDSIYTFVPLKKEIESHRNKSPFLPPLGQAVLTSLKFALEEKLDPEYLLINGEKDVDFFHKILKGKKVVLLGRGVTGGKPIAKTLTHMKISFLNIFSGTSEEARDNFVKEADIVITAVGQKIIHPEKIKEGVILLNVGLEEREGELKGDYTEDEVKDIASYYTKTPGGIGPLDVLYLYRNLIDAAAMQS